MFKNVLYQTKQLCLRLIHKKKYKSNEKREKKENDSTKKNTHPYAYPIPLNQQMNNKRKYPLTFSQPHYYSMMRILFVIITENICTLSQIYIYTYIYYIYFCTFFCIIKVHHSLFIYCIQNITDDIEMEKKILLHMSADIGKLKFVL